MHLCRERPKTAAITHGNKSINGMDGLPSTSMPYRCPTG